MSKLAEIRARLAIQYRQSLAAESEKLAGDVAAHEAGDSRAAEIRGRAHRLRGSGASFGFPDITDLAKEVETGPDEALVANATQLLALLRSHAAA